MNTTDVKAAIAGWNVSHIRQWAGWHSHILPERWPERYDPTTKRTKKLTTPQARRWAAAQVDAIADQLTPELCDRLINGSLREEWSDWARMIVTRGRQ